MTGSGVGAGRCVMMRDCRCPLTTRWERRPSPPAGTARTAGPRRHTAGDTTTNTGRRTRSTQQRPRCVTEPGPNLLHGKMKSAMYFGSLCVCVCVCCVCLCVCICLSVYHKKRVIICPLASVTSFGDIVIIFS